MRMEQNMGRTNYEDKKTLKWIGVILCIVFALTSFFIAGKWATSVDTYKNVTETLDGLQKKSLEMTSAAAGFATVTAAVPGDATTPIADKLADIAGYLVIVYVALIAEKYLLTLTGFAAFKILLPIGFLLIAIGIFCRRDWKDFTYQMAVKSITLGILLWCLVPTSVWISNWIDNIYGSYSTGSDLLTDSKSALGETETETEAATETENDGFSIGKIFSGFADKLSDVGQVATEKVDEITEFMNQLIESVAVMIVTTCVIPILVIMVFAWILKMITGLRLPVTKKSMPRALKYLKKKKLREVHTIEK